MRQVLRAGQGSKDQREGAGSKKIPEGEAREAAGCAGMGGDETGSWLHLLFRQ